MFECATVTPHDIVNNFLDLRESSLKCKVYDDLDIRANSPEKRGEEMNGLEEYLDILLRWKKKIIRNMVILTVISIVVVMLLPKWYKANTVFIPQLASGGSLNIGGLNLGGLPGSLSSMFTPDIEEDDIRVIVLSRRVLDEYNREFNIMERYDIPEKGGLYKFCQKHISVELEEIRGLGSSNILAFSISALDKNRELVARIPEFIVQEIGDVIVDMERERSRELLEILGKIKDEQEITSDSLGVELSELASETGILPGNFSEDFSFSSELENLRAQLFNAELKKEILGKTISKDSYEYKLAETESTVLRNRMDEIFSNNISGDINLTNLSESGLEFIKLKTEYMMHLQVLQQVGTQLEIERTKLKHMVKPLRILDHSFTPSKKAKPDRKLLLVLIVFGGVILHFVIISLYEIYSRQSPSVREAIRKLLRPF